MTRKTLNGTWSMYRLPEGEKTDLTVPGSVISGLMAAGKLEDPYYRENEYSTRELFWNDYVFERNFTVDSETLAEDEVMLVCEGLDTLTEIFINGTSVAKTSDMHRTYRIPVKEYLSEGGKRN